MYNNTITTFSNTPERPSRADPDVPLRNCMITHSRTMLRDTRKFSVVTWPRRWGRDTGSGSWRKVDESALKSKARKVVNNRGVRYIE